MNTKNLAIIAAVVIGAYILLRKPKSANASTLPNNVDEGEEDPFKPTDLKGVLDKLRNLDDDSSASDGDNHDTQVSKYRNKVTSSIQSLIGGDSAKDGTSPSEPLDKPIQGRYYRVKKGDTQTMIVQGAGLHPKNWRDMRDHINNEWMPKQNKNGSYFKFSPNEKSLPFFQWFSPPGYQTDCHYQTSSSYVYPVIYVPTKDEVTSG